METRCVAHEIRNQISICELYSRIIRKNLENEGIKNDSIENALNCIERSLKVMNNNLLDLKSLSNLEFKNYKLKDLLKEAIDMSVVYIQDKDIELSLSALDNVIICADENKFLACLINIIKNAVEAIDEKGEIKISEEIIDNNVRIKISNNGKPIEKDIDIFKEGFTTKISGNGLGLGICKRNIEAQNGSLSLSKSTKDETEFEIILPVKNS